MTDDVNDDETELSHPAEYQDRVSQRTVAFCHLAKLADTIRDEGVKKECLVMLKKAQRQHQGPVHGCRSVHRRKARAVTLRPRWPHASSPSALAAAPTSSA